MLNTTLCYIEKDGAYLMLHRVKKKHDVNRDKWTGVGGKFKESETPEECVLREIKEETGLTLIRYRLRGIVTFLSDRYEGEYMYVFTADGFSGDLTICDEGDLEWIKIKDVPKLPIWEGDKLFLSELSADHGFFSMKLRYQGEKLIESNINLY